MLIHFLYKQYEYITIQIKNNWLIIIKENLSKFSNQFLILVNYIMNLLKI